MNVKELREKLKTIKDDKEVWLDGCCQILLWDGTIEETDTDIYLGC